MSFSVMHENDKYNLGPSACKTGVLSLNYNATSSQIKLALMVIQAQLQFGGAIQPDGDSGGLFNEHSCISIEHFHLVHFFPCQSKK